jgi:hypothetical protein
MEIENAKAINFDFAKIPQNEKFELDYHRPFIDKISFFEDGMEFKHIEDVFDT